jgi:uncharacterized protein DUF2510
LATDHWIVSTRTTAATTRPHPEAQAAWYPDPSGRFEYRYWDGTAWTNNVARAGRALSDELHGELPRPDSFDRPHHPNRWVTLVVGVGAVGLVALTWMTLLDALNRDDPIAGGAGAAFSLLLAGFAGTAAMAAIARALLAYRNDGRNELPIVQVVGGAFGVLAAAGLMAYIGLVIYWGA